jgi:hypothetical protein
MLVLPNLPFERLIREAVAEWNLRHPASQGLDSLQSAWPPIYWAILAFLRHRLTDYDQVLQESDYNPELRDKLFRQIKGEATRRYPWLRLEADPRTERKQEAQEERATLPFDKIAAVLAKLYTRKNALTQALREATTRERKNSLRQELIATRELIDSAEKGLKGPELRDLKEDETPCLIGVSSARHYFFGPRVLSPNHVRPESFSCPKCGVRVMRTKGAIALGQGKRMVFWSCHCLFFALPHPARSSIPSADWNQLLGEVPAAYAVPAA